MANRYLDGERPAPATGAAALAAPGRRARRATRARWRAACSTTPWPACGSSSARPTGSWTRSSRGRSPRPRRRATRHAATACGASWATSSRRAGSSALASRRSCRRRPRGSWSSSATRTRTRRTATAGRRPRRAALGRPRGRSRAARARPSRCSPASSRGRDRAGGRLSGPPEPDAAGRLALPPADPPFDDDPDAVIAAAPWRPASSGSWSPAGTPPPRRRRSARGPPPLARRGRGHPPRRGRRRPTTRPGRIVGLVADARVRGDRRDRPRLRPRCSPPEVQLDNLRRHLALALAWASRDPALPLRAGRARRPGRPARELRRAGFGGPGGASRVRRPAACDPPLLLRPGGLRRGGARDGPRRELLGLVFRRGEEASRRGRPARPRGAAARRDRLAVPLAAGRPRRRNEPRWVEVTARWLAEQRGQDPVALGDQLVANYDRIFRRSDAWGVRIAT